jgi:hypothetical protein
MLVNGATACIEKQGSITPAGVTFGAALDLGKARPLPSNALQR